MICIIYSIAAMPRVAEAAGSKPKPRGGVSASVGSYEKPAATSQRLKKNATPAKLTIAKPAASQAQAAKPSAKARKPGATAANPQAGRGVKAIAKRAGKATLLGAKYLGMSALGIAQTGVVGMLSGIVVGLVSATVLSPFIAIGLRLASVDAGSDNLQAASDLGGWLGFAGGFLAGAIVNVRVMLRGLKHDATAAKQEAVASAT